VSFIFRNTAGQKYLAITWSDIGYEENPLYINMFSW